MSDPTAYPSPSSGRAPSPGATRWVQLVVGIICMSMIANLQYGWTLFVTPIDEKYHWGRAAIQVAFTIFVLTETWLVPVEGYLVDRIGPRGVVVVSGLLVAVAWVVNSIATSLPMLYLGAIIGGIGAGAIYGTCVGNALKWFPDRRGLAAGLTAMGFGAGSALTVFPIASMIKTAGYEATFFRFGIIQGVTVFVLGWLLRAPNPAELAASPKPADRHKAGRDFTPTEMLRSPVFWVMYVMFVLVATGGLIATAQLKPIAKDFMIADVPVSLLGITLPALTFTLTLDRVLNGVSRPLFGWVSDQLGRENTMFLAFLFEAVAVLLLAQYGRDPTAFVLLVAAVYLGWGEIYSLFPATCGDSFGRRFASANYGLLYTAKGTASLLVPLSSILAGSAGAWRPIFLTASGMSVVAAVMALLVLKPLRARTAAARPPASAFGAA